MTAWRRVAVLACEADERRSRAPELGSRSETSRRLDDFAHAQYDEGVGSNR